MPRSVGNRRGRLSRTAYGRRLGLETGVAGHPPRTSKVSSPRDAKDPRLDCVQLRRNAEANAAQRILRAVVASRPGAWVSRRALHRIDLLAYRVAPGRVPPSQWFAAVPVGLLTTTGARSGRPHTVPLLVTTPRERLGCHRVELRVGAATGVVLQPPRPPHRLARAGRGGAPGARGAGSRSQEGACARGGLGLVPRIHGI